MTYLRRKKYLFLCVQTFPVLVGWNQIGVRKILELNPNSNRNSTQGMYGKRKCFTLKEQCHKILPPIFFLAKLTHLDRHVKAFSDIALNSRRLSFFMFQFKSFAKLKIFLIFLDGAGTADILAAALVKKGLL